MTIEVLAFRKIESESLSPGACAAMMARSCSAVVTVVDPTAVITSPAFRPASARTARLTRRWPTPPPFDAVFTFDAEQGVLRLAARDELVAIVRTVFDGIAKPTPSLPPESLWICEVTPITCPFRFEERAAGVAVVDRGVGLDRALDRRVVGRLDLAVERADDAARHGAVEPERVADRDDAVTDRDLARVGERERHELRGRSVDVDDREVGRMSLPTTVALYVEPSGSFTDTVLAPSTTCSFVTMSPFVS